jgi:hypothetical protein
MERDTIAVRSEFVYGFEYKGYARLIAVSHDLHRHSLLILLLYV